MNEPEPIPIEKIRMRPSMWIHATTVFGLNLLVGELISNAIVQFLLGNATEISLTVEGREIRVVDNGAGLPFDQQSSLGNDSLLVDYLTTFQNTKTVDQNAPKIHIHSSRGVGLAVVSALSESLTFRSWRNNVLYEQAFSKGIAAGPTTEHGSGDVPPSGYQSRFGKSGTEVVFTPDPEIFGDAKTVPLNFRGVLFHAAHLFPGLRIRLQDEVFYAPHGLQALALTTRGSGLWGSKCFHHRIQNEQFMVEVAAVGNANNSNWKSENAKEKTKWQSWVNGWRTVKGTHCDVFNEVLKRLEWKPAEAWIHIMMDKPMFAGPTAQILEAPEIATQLNNAIASVAEEYCQKMGRGKYRKS